MHRSMEVGTPRRARVGRAAPATIAAALLAGALVSGVSRPAVAETPGDIVRAEAALQRAFEGTMVIVKIDMPATSSGVDITPEAEKPLDMPDYQKQLKRAGISLKRGETVMVTKVKVKSKLIEFQLGGGGYGTFFDEKASSGSGGWEGKSERERNLEGDLKRERDPAKRRAIQEELDALRRERRHDEREIHTESKQTEVLDKQRIREKAQSAGSRFNLRYPDGVPSSALSPGAVMDALVRYVDFSADEGGPGPGSTDAGADRGGRARDDDEPLAGGLHKGATLADVEALFGPPASSTARTDCGWKVTSRRYHKGRQIVEATFVEGVLVRYTLTEE